MELIPGLPNDIGLDCPIRVPYKHFSSIASVCQRWNLEIQLPEFCRHNKAARLTQQVIVIAQARVDSTNNSGVVKYSPNPFITSCFLKCKRGRWSGLPPVPGYSNGVPMFCRLAAIGFNLVVLGGWNPTTWGVSNKVFIYNFVSAKWRRGTNMPGCQRSFFACASDSDRPAFIAGGYDDEKKALRSAMLYDAVKDKWAQLPDMAKEGDECKGIFHCGKFHVIGGYPKEMQGHFEMSVEAFDVATWQWDRIQEEFLETPLCPPTCVDSGERRLYMCRAGDVSVLESAKWQVLTELPTNVHNTVYVKAWQDELLVIGSLKFGESHRAYVMSFKNHKWRKVEAPEEYFGHVQSGCCLEI